MERIRISLMQDWTFLKPHDPPATVCLPHTWNGRDGQDGGNDYWRGTCTYQKNFPLPDFDRATQQVWLEIAGAGQRARVFVNGQEVCRHDGGYAAFRAEITPFLQEENTLTVRVDNSVNDRVYPQKADFTFYGGIGREVSLLIVNQAHFDLNFYGGTGLLAVPDVKGADGTLQVTVWHTAGQAQVRIRLMDEADGIVAEAAVLSAGQEAFGKLSSEEVQLEVPRAHRWDGTRDPYLYTVTAELLVDGVVVDTLRQRIGFRTFQISAKEGFLLNGRPYPLHGVSRHQDRPGKGNALTRADQEEDLDLLCEMGANAVRTAHYQQDPYFYDLCDERGLLVWAEIPYISAHMPRGRENTIRQMTELIVQNAGHPCIFCWGIANEITIRSGRRAYKKDRLDNLRQLADLCHRLDPTRPVTQACYAACSPFNRTTRASDISAWNLYLGWYTPFLWLNDVWISLFHRRFPRRPLAFSEYGSEGMPNLHSLHPRRGDQTEEYQALYHEYMLRCFRRHPWLWGTFVWNLADFSSDGRDEGGDPGKNHKGLVTFDRQTKKDAFYLYKAYWSDEPFVHICGQRRKNREEKMTEIKVYSNQPQITLSVNKKDYAVKSGAQVFRFRVPLAGTIRVTARAGKAEDTAVFAKVKARDTAYRLKNKKKRKNWM